MNGVDLFTHLIEELERALDEIKENGGSWHDSELLDDISLDLERCHKNYDKIVAALRNVNLDIKQN